MRFYISSSLGFTFHKPADQPPPPPPNVIGVGDNTWSFKDTEWHSCKKMRNLTKKVLTVIRFFSSSKFSSKKYPRKIIFTQTKLNKNNFTSHVWWALIEEIAPRTISNCGKTVHHPTEHQYQTTHIYRSSPVDSWIS